jgi:hypothetical protein
LTDCLEKRLREQQRIPATLCVQRHHSWLLIEQVIRHCHDVETATSYGAKHVGGGNSRYDQRRRDDGTRPVRCLPESELVDE